MTVDKYFELWRAARGVKDRSNDDIVKSLILSDLNNCSDGATTHLLFSISGTAVLPTIVGMFAAIGPDISDKDLAAFMLQALNVLVPNWNTSHGITMSVQYRGEVPSRQVVYDVASGRIWGSNRNLITWALPIRPTESDKRLFAEWVINEADKLCDQQA